MSNEDGFFNITSVHRDDIKAAMHLSDPQMSKISDDIMQEIARKMADGYCEELFWDHLPIIVKIVLKREGIVHKVPPGKCCSNQGTSNKRGANHLENPGIPQLQYFECAGDYKYPHRNFAD